MLFSAQPCSVLCNAYFLHAYALPSDRKKYCTTLTVAHSSDPQNVYYYILDVVFCPLFYCAFIVSLSFPPASCGFPLTADSRAYASFIASSRTRYSQTLFVEAMLNVSSVV